MEVKTEHTCRECCCSPSQSCVLLLSLWDLSLCLEEEAQWSLVSQLSGCFLARGEHFPQQDDFLLLMESGARGDKVQEFLPLVLHDSSSCVRSSARSPWCRETCVCLPWGWWAEVSPPYKWRCTNLFSCLARSSSLNRKLSPGLPGKSGYTRQKSLMVAMG